MLVALAMAEVALTEAELVGMVAEAPVDSGTDTEEKLLELKLELEAPVERGTDTDGRRLLRRLETPVESGMETAAEELLELAEPVLVSLRGSEMLLEELELDAVELVVLERRVVLAYGPAWGKAEARPERVRTAAAADMTEDFAMVISVDYLL